MAVERIEILVTPERTMLEDSNMKNSTGKTSTSSSSKNILIPHHRRASTGSCHDFCKYGRERDSEEKGNCHILRRVATTITEVEDSVISAIVSERKKKPTVKLGRSLDSKIQSPSNSDIIKLEVPSSGKKKETSLKQASALAKDIEVSPRQASAPAKEIKVSPRQASAPAKKIEVSPRQASAPTKKIEVSRKPSLLPAKKIEVSRKQPLSPAKKIEVSRKQPLSPAKKIEVSRKQALFPAKKTVVSRKQALSPAKKTEVSQKQALSPAKKIEVSPKQALSPSKKLEASTKQTLSSAKRSNASAKPGLSLKPKSIEAKPSPPSGLSGGIGGRRNNDSKIVKKMGTSKVDEKKALRTPIPSVSSKPSVSRVPSINTTKYRNVKAVSLLKSENKVKKAEPKLFNPVKEKTLYVIEQPESKILEVAQNGSHTTQSSPSLSSSSASPSPSSLNSSSSQSSPSLSAYVEEENGESESMLIEADDSISEYDETEDENQVETLNLEDKESGRGAVHHENTDCPPRKLNFRRGQVVNLKSENNGPRRLRFRRGRVLGETDGKVDIGRKGFSRREVTDGDTDSTKPESEKVVLRHQDMQGKKDAQGLFNNVIEETASKLVETRKSKVKALVGAFETVISLQEIKPSAC